MNNFLSNINSFLPADVQKIGHIADAALIFRLDNGNETKYLYFAPDTNIRAVNFSSKSPQREYSTADWLGPYLHKLQESKLTKIQKNGNIFSLSFDNNLVCDLHFFGSTGNAIVITPEKKIAVSWHLGRSFRTGNDYDFSKIISHSETEINILQTDELIEKLNVAEFENVKKEVERYLTAEKKKLNKRLKKIEAELEETTRVDEYKKKGDLLKMNYHLLKRGMSSIKIKDYFSEENEEIEISLEPIKKPQENIARYFKKAKKLERGREQILQRIEVTKDEIESIDKIQIPQTPFPAKVGVNKKAIPGECWGGLQTNPAGAEHALSAVNELKKLLPKKKKSPKPPLKKGDYNRPRHSQGTPKKTIEKIRSFISSDGFTILAGRSAKDNDQLTVRVANGNDMWLHTRNRPGAHVVIRAQRGKDFTKQVLIEAAKICAYQSKARDGTLEDVTYTLKKNVTKHKGMKPGSVLVAGGKTITIQHNERETRKWMREHTN